MKWSFVPKDSPKPKYLVCNADESEPGTFKDRLLIEKDPHAIIEGTLIAAFAIQSHTAFIYIRGEMAFGAKRLERAVDEAIKPVYIGKNIFGSGYDLDRDRSPGAGAYICGEETALLSSLEGGSGWPKVKPPFPATHGLFGCPTVVNNVETLAALPWIIEHGAAAYAAMGTEKSKGTKLFSVSGHITQPGVYELEMGYPFKKFLEEDCGGVPNGRKLKGVIPGGGSMPVLRPTRSRKLISIMSRWRRQAVCSARAASLSWTRPLAWCGRRGTLRAFMPMNPAANAALAAKAVTGWKRFFTASSMAKATMSDLDLILNISGNIMGNTICPFGDAAAMPAAAFIRKYRDEFEAHIAAEKSARCEISMAVGDTGVEWFLGRTPVLHHSDTQSFSYGSGKNHHRRQRSRYQPKARP